MNTWVVLLRGINVGGNNKLPMAELRSLLTGLGYSNIRTYIQSGNCVLESSEDNPREIETDIHRAIHTNFGIQIQVFALRKRDLQTIVDQNPFGVSEDQSKTVHIFFLAQPALSADRQILKSLKTATEMYELTNAAFYLFTPDGIGRSKLAARAEKCLGVTITARNLRSAKKILALAQSA